MNRLRCTTSREGLTLVELIVAMASATVLLAGITSTLVVASRASNPAATPAKSMLEALACMADMSAELQYALTVTEYTSRAITVTAPDRGDADLTPETIRYAWSGTPGQPLTRQYNGGVVVSVIPSVQSLTFEYFPAAASAEWVTVRIQPDPSTRSTVETSIGFLNR